MSLSTQRLCRNFFKATAPDVLHHWALRAGPLPCRARPMWWFRWFPWPRPRPGSWMSGWISSTNPKKMDTNHEMLQKSQTHDMINGCLWVCRKLSSPCSRLAAMFQPSRPRCRSGCSWGRLLEWFCWPETRRRGPAEVARGKGQVDSRLVGLSLQLCWTTCIVNWQFRMSGTNTHKGRPNMPHVRSSRHHPTHSILHISSRLHAELLPPFFSSLSRGHWLQYLFNENTFRTTYPVQKTG